jgi:hypothetical protein
MRRLLVVFVFLLLACRILVPQPNIPPSPVVGTHTPDVLQPSSTLPFTSTPVRKTPTSPPLTTASGQPIADTFTVNFHPDGALYVGDLISLEVISYGESSLEDMSVRVQVDGPDGVILPEGEFAPYGIGGRFQATMLWIWDTSELEVGEHSLTLSIAPNGPTWTETVLLLPQEEVPLPEPGARWAQEEIECCLVYYITGTPAERDLEWLLEMLEEQVGKANRRLEVELEQPIMVTFLPRVLGHGGFAGGEISVAYLDRNYSGSSEEIILHHEFVHALDSDLGGELRPTMLVEGLAVYLTGGHFKPEPLVPRAAALLPPVEGCVEPSDVVRISDNINSGVEICGLDWYIPLILLLDDFYFSQHEIGYLQAGALVEFMVDTWGWDAFSDFYRDIHPQAESPEDSQLGGGTQALAIDTALWDHFGLNLQKLEGSFLEALEGETLTPVLVEDVRMSVTFYEALRSYQELLDPSAYFMTAWLPDGGQIRERGIVADFLRRPLETENLVLETMLVAADANLREGDYERMEEMLIAINAALDAFSSGDADPFAANPIAADYLHLVEAILAAGYQPEEIRLEKNQARVRVSTSGLELLELKFYKERVGWVLMHQAGN